MTVYKVLLSIFGYNANEQPNNLIEESPNSQSPRRDWRYDTTRIIRRDQTGTRYGIDPNKTTQKMQVPPKRRTLDSRLAALVPK
ncbi:MAG: hypothetical protein ACOCXG_03265 [Nanoarchaeota archaeon]